MTEREAFIIGVTRFCKEAGLDAEDTEQMTRLLFMPPFRAQPIIKRAAEKRAWTFWGGEDGPGLMSHIWNPFQQWRDAGEIGTQVFGRLGNETPAQILKNREDTERIQQQSRTLSKAMGKHPMTSPQAAALRNQVKAETDPEKRKALEQKYNDLVNNVDPGLQQTIDRARQGVVGAQALQQATPAQIAAGEVEIPKLTTDPATNKVPTKEEDIETAMSDTAKRLGLTPELFQQQQQRAQNAQYFRAEAQRLQRTHRVSDPRYIEGIDWEQPYYQKFRAYLEGKRGQLGQGRRPHIVGSSAPTPPMGSAEPKTSAPDTSASTIPQEAATQMSSSPMPDKVPSRASMSHLVGPVPGVTPGAPSNNAPGAEPAQTTSGGQPPATKQTPAQMAEFGSGATDQQFLNDDRVQQMMRETEQYKRQGGTGSVQVGLPSRAGTLNIGQG
jgi:hypothetical protein